MKTLVHANCITLFYLWQEKSELYGSKEWVWGFCYLFNNKIRAFNQMEISTLASALLD